MRDLTKVKYNNETYTKGRFILQAIKDIVGNKNYTVEKLQEMFPKELNGSYEIVLPLKEAHKKPARYFTSATDIITLKNGTKCAITTQWGSGNVSNMYVLFKKIYGLKFRKL